MSKYLVTGGAGFIGSHLTRELVNRGHDVSVLDDLSTGKLENLADIMDKINFVEGSITDFDTVLACCEGVDCIFHQAALPSVPRSVKDPLRSNEVNITGTLQIFWGAHQKGVRRVVYAASSSIYGNTKELPKHEGMQPKPMSPYAVNKRVSELYGAVFNDLYGLSTVGLRYFNVFGPRQDPNSQYSAVVPKFIAAFLDGKAPTIHGDGEQSRDFTYIQNVVEANIAACDADNDAGGRSYNVALGGRITVKDLCYKIQEYLGTDIEPVFEPTRPGDVKHSQADISLAKKYLKYEGSVSLLDGLKLTSEWYRDNQ